MNTPSNPKKLKLEIPPGIDVILPSEANAEIRTEVSEFAQKSVDQAQAAFEKASEVAHGNVQTLDAAASAFKTRAADIQMKTMEIAQNNMNSAFSFMRRAFSAKDPSELMSLNQEFVRDQFSVFTRQVSEFNELSLALSKETVKPVQESMLKSFGSFSKSFAA